MDQKNRTILVIAIAVTVVAAVFVSIVLPAITGRAPQVTLPNVNQETEGESQAFLPVEVTPETVQTVISSLSRPDSYYRELTVTLFWEGGESAEQVEIWADGGYVRTTIAGWWGRGNSASGMRETKRGRKPKLGMGPPTWPSASPPMRMCWTWTPSRLLRPITRKRTGRTAFS